MKSGTDLDALVAEKVMGWKWSEAEHRVADPEGWSTRKILIPLKCEWILSTYNLEPGMNSVSIPVPRYSTDIAAAWEVVMALHRQGHGFCIEQSPSAEKPTVHIVPKEKRPNCNGLIHFIEDMEKISYSCESLPHAICITALKAVGYEES